MEEDAFKGRLLPGERLLWSGRPGQGLLFTGQDVYLIPFSLLWCGFAIFWTVMAAGGIAAARQGGLVFFPLFGLGFVCIGLYFVAGRFLVDAWLRGRISYALTDRRVLVSRAGPFSTFSAVSLDRLPEALLTERRDGCGTIRFGQPARPWGNVGGSIWSPALDPTPQFLAIAEVRRVFDLVQQAADRRR